MLRENEISAIPSVQKAASFHAFFRDIFTLFNKRLPSERFIGILNRVGIHSRVSYRSLMNGKRTFNPAKLGQLSDALDLSYSERRTLTTLREGLAGPSLQNEIGYHTCNPHVLSHPINTIVLNLCSLSVPLDETAIFRSLESVFTEEEVRHSIVLLEENELISRNDQGHLKRNKGITLSTLPGIKAEHSKNYYQQTFALAEAHLEADLTKREYVAFSANIRKDDLPKVKDLIREVRKSVYALSGPESDAVVHLNLNAFLVEPEAMV